PSLSSFTFLSPLLPVSFPPCQPLSHVGTFTIQLLQTTTFRKTSFAETEGLGLLEDIKLGFLDKHAWSIHFCQPWVHPALSWEVGKDLKVLVLYRRHRPWLEEGNRSPSCDLCLLSAPPDPFVAQWMAGCMLYPNRTSQAFVYVGYNGQDLLSLNTKNVTWTLSQNTTFSRYVKSLFQKSTVFTETVEIMFNETCVDGMKMLLHYRRAALSAATVFVHSPRLDQLLPVCHASGFYPSPISVAWLQDGQEVPPGPVPNSSPILPKADLTHQLCSVLAVAPRAGHSCICRTWVSCLPIPLVLVVSLFPASLLVVVSQCPLLSPL
uniref:Ig-like domain-containing protein n=1 Tax=Zosterops lateralis melanops TaxID=1220523 RepID=A0A8D2Q2R0_ZOSLA